MFKTSTFKFIFLIAVLVYSFQSNAQTDVLYPNPAVDGTVHFTTKISGSIYNAAGVEVRRFAKASQVNVAGLPKGTYVVKTNTNEFRKFVIE